MALVIPPNFHLPQAQVQPPLAPKPEVVVMAQTRPIATQTQRAVAGPSRSRGSDGAKSQEKRGAAEPAEERVADATGPGQTPRGRGRGGVTIDV